MLNTPFVLSDIFLLYSYMMSLILLLGVVTVVTAEKQVCQQNPGSEAACGEFKKTALVTGGAGFVGHSIIEVSTRFRF